MSPGRSVWPDTFLLSDLSAGANGRSGRCCPGQVSDVLTGEATVGALRRDPAPVNAPGTAPSPCRCAGRSPVPGATAPCTTAHVRAVVGGGVSVA